MLIFSPKTPVHILHQNDDLTSADLVISARRQKASSAITMHIKGTPLRFKSLKNITFEFFT
jgi:hypothetical protein